MPALLSFKSISKQFGGTLAVDGVDVDIEAGQIHALLGANGAGKSTLIKMLSGLHTPDAGEILFKGRAINPRTEIEKLPVAFIHQDLGLFDWMTVSENVAMGKGGYPRRAGFIRWKGVREQALRALDIVQSGIDPDTPVSELTRTERSIVAIARALANDVELLILDEPTSSLPEADVAKLFDVLRRLKQRDGRAGVGMIYVSHRLDEIFRIADWVTVMRDGRKVASAPTHEFTPQALVVAIVGRPPAEVFMQPPAPSAQGLLQLNGVRVRGAGPINLQVRAGEVLGLCGLRGAGQNDIGRAVSGIEPLLAGDIIFKGKPIRPRNPNEAIRQGIAFVSSNREAESLGMSLLVRENLYLNPAVHGRGAFAFLRRDAEKARAHELVKTYSVRPADSERTVSTLSGGNQQKVVLGRWLSTDTQLFVLEEPTLGVDVGAKAEIYALMNKSLAQGKAAVLVSTDLEEVAGVCSRAVIFKSGKIVGELQRGEMSVARLTEMVSGAE